MDEFSGATSKGQENAAPTVTRITKVCHISDLELIVDWERKGKVGI